MNKRQKNGTCVPFSRTFIDRSHVALPTGEVVQEPLGAFLNTWRKILSELTVNSFYMPLAKVSTILSMMIAESTTQVHLTMLFVRLWNNIDFLH
jgi:hypothetical protein